jgi:hypothetical protein
MLQVAFILYVKEKNTPPRQTITAKNYTEKVSRRANPFTFRYTSGHINQRSI